MYEAHDALICIGEKSFVDDNSRIKFSDQHYIKESSELKKLFIDIPEALENNYNFPFRFSFKPKKSNPILPSIQTDKNTTVNKELLAQAKDGLRERLDNFILKKFSSKEK